MASYVKGLSFFIILCESYFSERCVKDCSKKVRTAFRTKVMNDEYTGGYPAFGYQKAPEDRHHRISNEFTPVVKRRMFKMALERVSCYHAAKTMEAKQILTPRAYICDKHGKYVTNEMVEHPYA